MFRTFYISLFILLCLLNSSVFGENMESPIDHIRFQYLNTNNGLPQNTVDCILKDSRRFMWFGTWNGLCRYDGYSFKTFRKEKNNNSLPDNFVQALCEDQKGNIWIGTKKGLGYFNFDENRFVKHKELAQTFGSFSIKHLALDKQNRLWVATGNNGVWIIRFNKDQAIVKKLDDRLLPNRHVNHIIINDQLAFVGTDGGLAIIDIDSMVQVSVFPGLTSSVQNLSVSCVFVDSIKNIWVSAGSGLYQYNYTNKQIYYYTDQSDNPSDLNHITVSAIAEDSQGTIIVGTLAGLNFFNPSNRSFSHVIENSGKMENLNNPFVNSILTDAQGNVWIGTDKGGVNHYNIHQKSFYSIINDPINPHHNTINSILKEKDVLWIGTAGNGLSRLSGNNRFTEQYTLNVDDPGSISNNFISAIYRDNRKQLWLGTWGGGLNRLVSLQHKSFEAYQYDALNSSSICSNMVSSIIELNKQSLLIGTFEGLELFNLDKKTFVHLHDMMQLEDYLEVGCLLIDRKNKLWIGTRKGLYRLDIDQLNHIENQNKISYDIFLNQPENQSSISGDYVISLHQDRKGNLWIGTYGNGICRLEEDKKGNVRFIHYDEQDGLCNNVAYAIEEDSEGNLWISTDKGLSKFNPTTSTFQNFYVKDGLLSDQFYWSASDTDEEGNMYFGGIAGLNYFNPSDIELHHESTKPVFTEFSIFNSPVKIGGKYHSKVILEKSVVETRALELSYKDAIFSIEFSAFDYFLPEKIEYAYKMEGVDQDWVKVPASRRFANYTNLSGGEYIFKVKASNSDGVWSDETAELKITVHPPFWETAWFRLFFVLFCLILVLTYIRYRTRFLKAQKRKLEKQVKDRTEKVEEQKEKLKHQAEHLQLSNQKLADRQILIQGQKLELEIQNEKIAQQRDEMIDLNEQVKQVNQLRLRFFTNISHEFRTPLTLIIDPLEQLMKKMRGDNNTINTLKIIDRNAKRLLHLINRLIYFRHIENGKMDLYVSRGNLKQFLHNIFESFQSLAQHQRMEYHFEAEEIPAETWFDAEKLENICYNLLSNAFKYTPEKGKISMNVKFVTECELNDFPTPYACIEVIDTGRGITKDHRPFIFERFYYVESEKDANMKSSGIGLALTSELVKILHGQIRVESEPGKGSCFQVLLPYTPDRFDEEDLDRITAPSDVNIQGRVNLLAQNILNPGSNFEIEETVKQEKSKPLVLVVEDNFDLRTFLLQTLKENYRVLGSENGKIGFGMAKKHSPDIIISDVMMPVMDGIELCSRLKKEVQTSHIPVILLTAKNMLENWIEGLETGADDYISKPFNFQLLQARMKNLIENRTKLKKMFSTSQDVSPANITSNSVDEEFMTKAYSILEKNYTNPEFSINQFANEMFVSRSLLYKKIKVITDLNITNFINTYKLKKAIDLIQHSNQPISDIAFQVGFNDPKYFSRVFRKYYGMSPSDFTNKPLGSKG